MAQPSRSRSTPKPERVDLVGEDGMDAIVGQGVAEVQAKLFSLEARVGVEGRGWDDPIPENPSVTFAQQRAEWQAQEARAHELYPERLQRLAAKLEPAEREPVLAPSDLKEGDEIAVLIGGKPEWGEVHRSERGVVHVMLDNGNLHAVGDMRQLIPPRKKTRRKR